MTSRRHIVLLSVLSLAVVPAILGGQTTQSQAAHDRPDLDAISRIQRESARKSEVMDIASYLTDVCGPRLTNSPNLKAAADYLSGKMTEWGLANVKREKWGPFAPGWTNDRFVALAVKPLAYPLIGAPKAWTPGTEGAVTGEAIVAAITNEADFETYRGKLKGKFVLIASAAELPAFTTEAGHRFSEQELATLAAATHVARQPPPPLDLAVRRKRMQFFNKEEVAALIEPGRGRDGGFFVESGVASRDPRDYDVPPQVVIAIEQYNQIARTLARGIPVTLEMDIRNTFHDSDLTSFSLVGEIPGTDKADELVMIGAHLDSWHAGTGATDNAAGVAIVVEAMRLLKAAELHPRRTIRVGLWTAEEQGRLGSMDYVDRHFGSAAKPKPDYEKLSVYFNVDNGAGAIRGVYLQGNEAIAPPFRAWMTPFNASGMTTVTIRDTAGTDHVSFDNAGLPGFQFIQDPLEYDARTHHFNMDLFDRLPAADLQLNATIVASFAYQAANRDTKLPRKISSQQ